jgi:murein DD-endopeptidase MepM/ murein hydrolase activator NlpD
MRSILAVCALVLALGAGSASADTFAVVPEAPVLSPVASLAVTSSETPNQPGAVLLPPAAFEAQFLPTREVSYDDLRTLWVNAGAAYGVPWQVLAAINKIESNFGRNMGPSSAGAVGWMQFMPDTWLRWGTDGNGDGLADPWNPDDGVYSAARYLAAADGRTDISRAIFAYNHAQWYVDDVLRLAAMFGAGGDSDAVFALDQLAITLEAAQAKVASLGEALSAAEERQSQLQAPADEARAKAENLELVLSDQLVAEKQAFDAAQAWDVATAEVERLRAEVGLAEVTLEAARSGAHAASFAPAAADMLAMPSRADGYVFPVGGGPSLISVGHTHHDYPAADIAAPLGTPVYALADAVVETLADGSRCGIGFILRSLDGLKWTYCHLSYRDSAVQPGVFLTAGQWVGLVGSTGNSTGPHLHLGLEPARYPQEMPWFQEFAGIAFTWQDAPTPAVTMPGPVFAPAPSQDDPSDEVVEFTLSGT